MPRWTQSIKTRLVLQYKLINPKRLEYVFSVIRLEADCKNRIININIELAINSERDFRKTQQKISNNIENSLQMIA